MWMSSCYCKNHTNVYNVCVGVGVGVGGYSVYELERYKDKEKANLKDIL